MLKQKILAVDANRLDLMVLSHMLENQHEVYTLMDASQCINTAKKVKPNLILLDHELKGLDGISVCRQLKDLSQSLISSRAIWFSVSAAGTAQHNKISSLSNVVSIGCW